MPYRYLVPMCTPFPQDDVVDVVGPFSFRVIHVCVLV